MGDNVTARLESNTRDRGMVSMNSTNNSGSHSVTTAPTTKEKDNTMAMLIMAGIVVSSAGFTMYTKQADSLLRRMNRASKIQGLSRSHIKPRQNTPSASTSNWNTKARAKTFHEKDDIF